MKKSIHRFGLILAMLTMLTGCGGPKESAPETVFVAFKNYDNSLLYHQRIPVGSKAVYDGEEPTKDMTQAEVFTFSGWDRDLGKPVYENTVIHALYDSEPRAYVVSFSNYDGTVLQTRNLPYGSYAAYSAPRPERESDDDRIGYQFTGWDKDPSTYKIVSDTTFTAQFRKFDYVYASFQNYDGCLLQKKKIEKGTCVTYTGKTPQKGSDDDHLDYVFDGWDKDIKTYELQEDTTFTAQFREERYWFATFKNYDGSILQSKRWKEDEIPSYSGSTPSRPSPNSDKIYRFTGWSPSLNFALQKDTTFTAQFVLLNIYSVRFENYDGTLLQTSRVTQGETAVYTGSTPTRPDSKSGDTVTKYTFSGWSRSLVNITSNLTVTAQYSSTTTTVGASSIRNHLDSYGSGAYHNVVTSSQQGSSTLGYSGSYFYMGNAQDESGVESYMAISCTYQASSGTASFIVYASGTLMFSASYYVYFSGHLLSNIEVNTISTNRFTTNDQLSAVAALTILTAKAAVMDANKYLENRGLPYVC